MAGGVRGLVLHVRPAAGLVPDGIDHPRRQMAGAVDHRRWRQEECWGLGEHLLVGTALFAEIVLDRLGSFLADLVGSATANVLMAACRGGATTRRPGAIAAGFLVLARVPDALRSRVPVQ